MNKFRVGDRVTAKGNVNGFGGSGTVIKVDIGHPISEYLVKFDCGVVNSEIWALNDSVKPLHSDRHSIHITCTDGKATHAVKKVDGKIVARSKAVCCPTDEFNANIGAQLAFNRLVYGTDYNPAEVALKPEHPKQEDKPAYKAGDEVKVINDTCGHGQKIGGVITLKDSDVQVERNAWHFKESAGYITECDIEPYAEPKQEPVKLYCVKDYIPGVWVTKGNVYEIDKCGKIRFDDGYSTSFEDMPKPNSITDPLFPLVSRPAKVGEWVVATSIDGAGAVVVVNGIYKAIRVCASGICENWVTIGAGTLRYDQYLVLDGYTPEPEKAEPEYYSGKVVCVEATDMGVTLGKVYTVEKGIFTWNGGTMSDTKATTIEQFNNWFFGAKFIEFKGE